MKIVYVANSEIPSRTANSVHVMKMCAAFAAAGHAVELLAYRGQASSGEPFDYYGVEQSFRLRRLPRLRWSRRSYVYGVVEGVLAAMRRPDLIYGRLLSGCFVGAQLGSPVVLEYHAPVLASGRLNHWLFKRLIRHRKFRYMVVISNALKEMYETDYPALVGRIRVAHDAADVEPPRPETAPTDRMRVGYIGSMNQGRGIDIIGEVARQCSWADFELLGGEPSEVGRWKAAFSDVENLSLRGFKPPAEAAMIRRGFDVALAPYQRSVLPHEGRSTTEPWMSPLKLFEYMASGCAIVASDLSALREVLEHERNALLCPPEDVAAWTAALLRLRDEPELRKSIAAAGRRDLIEHYTWRRRAVEVLRPPAPATPMTSA